MALKATVFKAELIISDMDRQYYQTHNLTIARHPSETDERMMLRLMAFALFASERLEFGKGLSSDEEPDLWQKSFSGEIEWWIELGQPDERRIRKACGRAQRVVVITYGGRAADLWWQNNAAKLARLENLTVLNIVAENCVALLAMVHRTMSINGTISDGQLWLADAEHSVEITPAIWQRNQKH